MDIETENLAPADVEISAGEEHQQETSTGGDPATHSPSSRDVERIQALEHQARTAQEEAERYRRAFEEASTRSTYDPRAEEERLANMEPEQRILYQLDRQSADMRTQAMLHQVRTEATMDKFKFDAEIEQNPEWRKFSDEVERMYQFQANRALQAGQPAMIISRMDLLQHRLGAEVKASRGKVKEAAKKGADNITKQSARMTNTSSNVSAKASRGESAAVASERRLRDAGILVD